MISLDIQFLSTGETLEKRVSSLVGEVEEEAVTDSGRHARELKSASGQVLQGARSGRIYSYGGGRYQASRGGEAPAKRSGNFRDSWLETSQKERSGKTFITRGGIESSLRVGGHLLGELLEHGTQKMAARPYEKEILQRVLK